MGSAGPPSNRTPAGAHRSRYRSAPPAPLPAPIPQRPPAPPSPQASLAQSRTAKAKTGDASIRCMIRRTTLAAEAEDLDFLEREAKRQKVSLASMLREIVHQAA